MSSMGSRKRKVPGWLQEYETSLPYQDDSDTDIQCQEENGMLQILVHNHKLSYAV